MTEQTTSNINNDDDHNIAVLSEFLGENIIVKPKIPIEPLKIKIKKLKISTKKLEKYGLDPYYINYKRHLSPFYPLWTTQNLNHKNTEFLTLLYSLINKAIQMI